MLSVIVINSALGFGPTHLFYHRAEGHNTVDELVLLMVGFHLLLGIKDIEATMALTPQSVGLLKLAVVGVDPPHKQ